MNSTLPSPRPIIVAVGGFTSEVGKTTLLCQLLQAFPGWEAIKTTRGHYRSCGKDPHACCVSDLLDEKAVIRSGRELTDAPGKDTGRYWDAGAANVHWVIATDDQLEEGIKLAVDRVKCRGVFIEGNSFTKFLEPDYFVMLARADNLKIKRTAREVLSKVSAFYLSGEDKGGNKELLAHYLGQQGWPKGPNETAIFDNRELTRLIGAIDSRPSSRAA